MNMARMRQNWRPARSHGALEAKGATPPQRAAQSDARRSAARSEEAPRVSARVRTLREKHEGTPIQAPARRAFVSVGNRRDCNGGGCPLFLGSAGLRRLTLRVMRHTACRIYGNRNLTRGVKG